MPFNKIKPVGKNILVKGLTVALDSPLHLPDTHSIQIFFGLILAVGSEVQDKGVIPNRLAYFNAKDIKDRYDDYYFFEEDAILLIKDNNGVIRPFGWRALIWRDTNEVKLNSGIIIPACYTTRDQTKEAYFYRHGLVDNKFVEFPLLPGDKIELESWSIHHHEIQVDDKYMLSVPYSDIVYKKENGLS